MRKYVEKKLEFTARVTQSVFQNIHSKTSPHINLVIFMRGLMSHVFTRIYFPDEIKSNLLDETLLTIPANRHETLLAKKLSGKSTSIYEFNIHLQGEKETVFFDA